MVDPWNGTHWTVLEFNARVWRARLLNHRDMFIRVRDGSVDIAKDAATGLTRLISIEVSQVWPYKHMTTPSTIGE
jgi:hypothetical protein